MVSPPPSSAEESIYVSKGAVDWAYFDRLSHGISVFDRKLHCAGDIGRAYLRNGAAPDTSTDSEDYISCRGGNSGSSFAACRDFCYVVGDHKTIEFTHLLLAPTETVEVYLVSFDAKTNLVAQLENGPRYRADGVILGNYYDPWKDGDGTGSGHGYAILRLRVHGRIGQLLTVKATVDTAGVKRKDYGNVGFQAVRVTFPSGHGGRW